MSIITAAYFFGNLHIAQKGNVSVGNTLADYITRYEGEYLNKVLGYGMAKTFLTGLEAATPDAKWTDLRDGAEYTDACGNLQQWEGFKDETTYISPIANYVYYWWHRHNATITTERGEKAPKTKNSSGKSMQTKLTRAWNEMVHLNRSLYAFLMNKKVNGELVYSEFVPTALNEDDYYDLTSIMLPL